MHKHQICFLNVTQACRISNVDHHDSRLYCSLQNRIRASVSKYEWVILCFAASMHLVWQYTFKIDWLQSIFFLWFFHPSSPPTFSRFSVFSALCSLSSNNLINSVFSWSLCFLFIDVIDSSSSMHASAWCSFTESVTGKSYLRVVVFCFFFSIEVNWKDIGGWVGGELGVGCRAIVNVGGRPA